MVMMDRKDLVRLFSDFWQVDPSEVTDGLRLTSEGLKNHSSIRFYQFVAAVESNFNVKVRNLNRILTFKDLLDNIVAE